MRATNLKGFKQPEFIYHQGLNMLTVLLALESMVTARVTGQAAAVNEIVYDDVW